MKDASVNTQCNTFDDVVLSDATVPVKSIVFVWHAAEVKMCQILGTGDNGSVIAKVETKLLSYDVPVHVAVEGDRKFYAKDRKVLEGRFGHLLNGGKP